MVCFSVKGQVVIPRRLRKEFDIDEGILIKPVTPKFVHSLRGSLKGRGVMKAMMEDRKAERGL